MKLRLTFSEVDPSGMFWSRSAMIRSCFEASEIPSGAVDLSSFSESVYVQILDVLGDLLPQMAEFYSRYKSAKRY